MSLKPINLVRVVAILALIGSTALVIPFGPWIAAQLGLDMSWAYAMNVAVARHLVFGRDVIFTFGPWASVFTILYHPATDAIMLWGSAVFGVGLSCAYYVLLFDRRPILLILLPIVIANAIFRDAVLMALPVVLMLSAWRLCAKETEFQHLPLTRGRVSGLGIAVCATATLPLIKGSYAGLAFFELFIAFAMFSLARRAVLACGVIVLSAVALTLGWIAAGQPFGALFQFFKAQGPLISGYSEAMSVHGSFSQALLWCAVPVLALLFVLRNGKRNGGHALALFGLAFYFFVVFKAGFVRQDGHQGLSAISLMFAAFALSPLLRWRETVVIMLASLYVWISVEVSMGATSPDFIWNRFTSATNDVIVGLQRRIKTPEYFPDAFAGTTAAMRTQSPLEGITGPTDVYPMNIGELFINDIPWDGRPVPQSYAAYSPELDRMNARHLTEKSAPSNVLFSVLSIDGRLPSMEDAQSWINLLQYYAPDRTIRHEILLTHAAPRNKVIAPLVETVDHVVGEAIPVPPHKGLLIAKVDMKPTLLGRAVLAAYKLPQIMMTVSQKSGQKTAFRFIPAMAKTGFILSPVVTSTQDFTSLYHNNDDQDPVTSITFMTPNVGLWHKQIAVTFSNLRFE